MRDVLAKDYGKEVVFDEELITPAMADWLLPAIGLPSPAEEALDQICHKRCLRLGDVLEYLAEKTAELTSN